MRINKSPSTDFKLSLMTFDIKILGLLLFLLILHKSVSVDLVILQVPVP